MFMTDHGFRCKKCGCDFDQPKLTHEGGYPEEPTYACPYCGSLENEELYKCSKCGELFFDEDMIGGVCKNCVDDAQDGEHAWRYGKDRKQVVEINGLLAWAYSPDEIEEILTFHYNVVQSDAWRQKMVLEYVNDDLRDFAEWVENENDDN